MLGKHRDAWKHGLKSTWSTSNVDDAGRFGLQLRLLEVQLVVGVVVPHMSES